VAQDLTVRAIQGATLAAREDRLANEHLTEGLFAYGDEFKVQQQAAPNMTVRVGSGAAGDRYVVPVTGSGVFIVLNRNDAYVGSGNTDVAIANGDATNNRIDGIDLLIEDDEADSSGQNRARVVVTQGTPAGSPSAPAVPASAVRLATILVTAGESTSIVTGDITDTREASNAWTTPRGQLENGYAQVTTDQTGIGTSETDLTGLTVTVTVEAGRRIKITGQARLRNGEASPNGGILYIDEGGTNLNFATCTLNSTSASGVSASPIAMAILEPSAGSHTYKLQASFVAGSSNLMDVGATQPAFILVEDIGGFAPKDA
jgi:hypothetical protein